MRLNQEQEKLTENISGNKVKSRTTRQPTADEIRAGSARIKMMQSRFKGKH